MTTESFQDRVKTERNELAEKVTKLSAFLQTHQFASLSDSQRDDLMDQHTHMVRYLSALERRIKAF